MKFDIFLSICQTEVDGYMPSEKEMFKNFFDQLEYADELGFGVAWVAETHLSCEVQKQNENAVIPNFKGEIGLNTDILQLAHKAFSRTKNIHLGSAICNILCNGGPLAHAERVRTFLSLHGLDENEKRKLHLGFAAGRFPFSVSPYGVKPRNKIEKSAWPVIKSKLFLEATEIFLKAVRGDIFSSDEIMLQSFKKEDFRTTEDWDKVVKVYSEEFPGQEIPEEFEIPKFWVFEKVGVIPFEAPLKLLDLTIGSHDPQAQELANTLMPCGVFNLSITPSKTIEVTHDRLKDVYFEKDGWTRDKMPRTALVFVNGDKTLSAEEQKLKAKEAATRAHQNYWKAMAGTIDNKKIEEAVNNTIYGSPEDVATQVKEKYHKDDRLMMWFDFNNHDNKEIKESMRVFYQEVIPLINN